MSEQADLVGLHARASAVAERVLAGIGPDRLGAPTPCPEWDVRALVDHVVGLHRMAAAAAAGPAPHPGADDAGGEPRAAFAAAAAAARAPLGEPGGLDRVYALPWGEMPGSVLARILLADTTIHAWDLAKATGQLAVLDPDLCAEVLAWGRTVMKPEYRTPDAGFGPEVAIPDDAPACERLAAFYGRHP